MECVSSRERTGQIGSRRVSGATDGTWDRDLSEQHSLTTTALGSIPAWLLKTFMCETPSLKTPSAVASQGTTAACCIYRVENSSQLPSK